MGDIEKATTEELEAALQARKELGRSYEAELVESFVARIDEQIRARVAELPGILVAWAGIIGVNAAHALSNRQGREGRG